MAEYKRPTTLAQYQQNFARKKPLMDASEYMAEASRCLFCYDAPCVKACPTEIDIPLFIKQIYTANLVGAAKTIYQQNWLGNACATVCPTSELCEGACVYNAQNQAPVQIGRLQHVATNHLIITLDDIKLWRPAEANGKCVAVIGAGPAGIACACELSMLGYEVQIFEAKEKPSGLILHGVAPYKISNEECEIEIQYLQDKLGFGIRYQNKIETKEQIDKLELEFDAIFIGVGLGKTNFPQFKNSHLEGIVGAVEFIEKLKLYQHKMHIPDNVVIIGGGNTAMDAASECAKMGAKNVQLVYRKTREEMSAYDFELQLAKRSGVKLFFNAVPHEAIGNESIHALSLTKTNTQEETTFFDLPCSLLILATGQVKQKNFLSLIDDIVLGKNGQILVDEHYRTSNPKYFAGGDAINGGAEVVHAARDGKAAARGIHHHLRTK